MFNTLGCKKKKRPAGGDDKIKMHNNVARINCDPSRK